YGDQAQAWPDMICLDSTGADDVISKTDRSISILSLFVFKIRERADITVFDTH
ncbi:41993_t:CDS:1, partial [Gigaspora margarita]